jgi:hypothetical protein
MNTVYNLPKVIRVGVATISLPTRLEVDTIAEYERINREVTHVLSLLPEEDIANGTIEEDEILIETESIPAIKYACKHYLVDVFHTTVDTVIADVLAAHDGDVCNDCIDSFVDEALDKGYDVKALEKGVFLVSGDVQ